MGKKATDSPKEELGTEKQEPETEIQEPETKVTKTADTEQTAKPKFHFAFEFVIDGKREKVDVDADTEGEGMRLAREKAGAEARYTQHFKMTSNK